MQLRQWQKLLPKTANVCKNIFNFLTNWLRILILLVDLDCVRY
ncbi:hypothetical protein [Bombilactobacillus folatiphilus]|nr:hypothetical protein [Bombilactobacillus folatiphilus]